MQWLVSGPLTWGRQCCPPHAAPLARRWTRWTLIRNCGVCPCRCAAGGGVVWDSCRGCPRGGGGGGRGVRGRDRVVRDNGQPSHPRVCLPSPRSHLSSHSPAHHCWGRHPLRRSRPNPTFLSQAFLIRYTASHPQLRSSRRVAVRSLNRRRYLQAPHLSVMAHRHRDPSE